ncbi:MAG: gamma-glutamylcyclotransferase [Cytophagales bacterium]|nr:gamma-glutamylcyclotransferase [Cytophagales bacterium]
MNPESTYAFYGSLRRGMINWRRYSKGLLFLFTESLPGFALYAMEHYPYAVRTENAHDKTVVEVFKIIDPLIERQIHQLETGVGYSYHEVLIRKKPTGIYLFDRAGSEPLVPGGDWVEFFGA